MKSWLAVALVCLFACGDDGPGSDPTATTGGNEPASTSADETTTMNVVPGSSEESSGEPSTSASSSDETTTTDSSEDTGVQAVPEGCFDYPSFVPTEVSFRDDVMPIIVESCWMCHQDPAPEAGLFLGYGGNTDEESIAVRNNLLTMTPHQAPDMTFVVPGDPLTSWFMAKVEYDNPGGDCPLIDCPNPGCDWFAPPTEILPTAQLDVFRSWIANGAPDN